MGGLLRLNEIDIERLIAIPFIVIIWMLFVQLE